MDAMLYRALEGWSDLEVRVKGDEGIVSGIAVPWDMPTRIDSSLTEEFARGAFDAQLRKPGGVFLARGHMPLGGSLIGRLTEMRNDTAGLYVEAKISRTPIGEETLTLLRDRVLDSFSVGFVEGKNAFRQGPKGEQITRRMSAGLREVAIVPTPAYADAKIAGVRQDGCPQCAAMGETPAETRADDMDTIMRGLPVLPLPPRSRRR